MFPIDDFEADMWAREAEARAKEDAFKGIYNNQGPDYSVYAQTHERETKMKKLSEELIKMSSPVPLIKLPDIKFKPLEFKPLDFGNLFGKK